MRVMRRNYDKPHRCPGWSGPAFKWRHVQGVNEFTCGYLAPRGMPFGGLRGNGNAVDGPDPWNSYGLVRCPGCKTWVLPHWARWLDPAYVWWKVKRKVKNWREDRRYQ